MASAVTGMGSAASALISAVDAVISATRTRAVTRSSRDLTTAVSGLTAPAGSRRFLPRLTATVNASTPSSLQSFDGLVIASAALFGAAVAVPAVSPAAEARSEPAPDALSLMTMGTNLVESLVTSAASASSDADRALISGAAAHYLAQVAAQSSYAEFTSRQESQAFRGRAIGAIDGLTDVLDGFTGAGFAEGVSGLIRASRSLQTALIGDINEVIGRLPSVMTFRPIRPLDSWLLAQHVFGDRPELIEAGYAGYRRAQQAASSGRSSGWGYRGARCREHPLMARSIKLLIDGEPYDQWVSGEVTRDMKDFSGSFSFVFRDKPRSDGALVYASTGAVRKLRPGPSVEIRIGREVVLKGFIEKVAPVMSEQQAEVTISGRDKTGDLVDSAALVDGPAEFKNVRLEDAAKRIAKPFGLDVRSEIDTGEPFARYSLDLGETAFSAIEKGSRTRHALILSDGVGGLVITRTGKTRAPAALKLPGNCLSSSGSFSHEGRFSETIVRGQSERAGKERGNAALDATAEPIAPEDRQAGDGSATEKERKGTAATGRAKDDEITRYRPTVHLARSKADQVSAQDEADWRNRTARATSEEFTHTVKGHRANGRLWRVNEMTEVDDNWLDVHRDLLICRVAYQEDESGEITEITTTSPEAFDKEPTGNRRTNKAGKSGSTSALDTTAERL